MINNKTKNIIYCFKFLPEKITCARLKCICNASHMGQTWLVDILEKLFTSHTKNETYLLHNRVYLGVMWVT